MAVHSHKQAPKSILARFVDSNIKKVWYLNVESGYIGACGARKIGQELGWYSDEIEGVLNKNVETPFSTVCNDILLFLEGKKEEVQLSEKYDTYVKRFFITSIGRSNCIAESFRADDYAKNLNNQEMNDLMVMLSLKVSQKYCAKVDELYWGIIDNRTSVNFILPRNCFYTVAESDKSNEMIIMPISPKVALGLFTENYCDNHPFFMHDKIIRVEDDDTLKYMNSHAFQYEYVMNGEFVVSPQRQELEEVWNIEKEKRSKLKLLRKQLLEWCMKKPNNMLY